MPKKVLFESCIHQLAMAGKRLLLQLDRSNSLDKTPVREFIHSWTFEHLGKNKLKLQWTVPYQGMREINFHDAHFYTRGDNPEAVAKQEAEGKLFQPDSVEEGNKRFFDALLEDLLIEVGIRKSSVTAERAVEGRA